MRLVEVLQADVGVKDDRQLALQLRKRRGGDGHQGRRHQDIRGALPAAQTAAGEGGRQRAVPGLRQLEPRGGGTEPSWRTGQRAGDRRRGRQGKPWPLAGGRKLTKGKLWRLPVHMGIGHQGNLNNTDAFGLQVTLGMIRVPHLGMVISRGNYAAQ